MTLGTMAVDHEQRIDYDKLRKDRLEKTREQMKKDGLGAVLLLSLIHIYLLRALQARCRWKLHNSEEISVVFFRYESRGPLNEQQHSDYRKCSI